MAIRVQREDFDVGAEIAAVTTGRADVGAVVTFTGRVRGDEGGVAAMTLEHYPGMTEAELSRIEAEAQSRGGQYRARRHRVRAQAGRVRGRWLSDGLPQDARSLLEEGDGRVRKHRVGGGARG